MQSKDSDSLTNLFEYRDASGCDAESREEPIDNDDSTLTTLKTEGETPAEPFTVTNEVDSQTLTEKVDTRSENNDDRKMSEEADLSQKEDSTLPEAEQPETQEPENTEDASNIELRHRAELSVHLESISGTDAPSSDAAAQESVSAVEPHAGQLSEIQQIQSESSLADAPTSPETVELQLDAVSEGGTAAEPAEVENPVELETKDLETLSPDVLPLSTAAPDDDLHPEELTGTDVTSSDSPAMKTISAAELPAGEFTEIQQIQSENGEVSSPSNQLTEAVELVVFSEDHTTEEPCEPETPLGMETKEWEPTSPAVPPLSTAAPDALGKIDTDIYLATMPASGLDSVDLEADLSLVELPRTADESVEKAASPVLVSENKDNVASEQPLDSEEDRVHLDNLESTMDAAATAGGDDDDDDDGKMTSPQPATQSVLSARDAFIEQQVSEYQSLSLFTFTPFCTWPFVHFHYHHLHQSSLLDSITPNFTHMSHKSIL